PTATPIDEARLAQLLKNFDSDKFAVREEASRELEKQGEAVHPQLRKALEERKLSPEARRRAERLLGGASGKPDREPLGFGLTTLDGDYGRYWSNMLLALPEPAAPEDGGAVEPGKVTLRTKNIGSSDHKNAGYVFEIEQTAGPKEESPVIKAGTG